MYLALFAAGSISVVGLLLYIVTRLDWGSIIGKRFPWTMNDNQWDKNG
jgi:hypothetical protein